MYAGMHEIRYEGDPTRDALCDTMILYAWKPYLVVKIHFIYAHNIYYGYKTKVPDSSTMCLVAI